MNRKDGTPHYGKIFPDISDTETENKMDKDDAGKESSIPCMLQRADKRVRPEVV